MAEISSSEAPLDVTSSTPTAAGPLVPLRNYDVFLNYRGPDVKTGFVSHLAAALAAVGARTFCDYEELCVAGDEAWDAVERAIRHSKVHIAIFSHGYANSPWCLRELHEIIECRTTGCSQLFLPVFFDVTPSDLRNSSSPKSCYSKAFAKLRNRNTPELIEEWMLALVQASMVAGRTFDSYQGFEAPLVKLIVSDILRVLNPSALRIAKHSVGVDEKLQEALDVMEIHKVVPSRYYDVFINYRGPDVKTGFVSHLAAALAAVGARTFWDFKEIHVAGDQTWDAVKSAIRHSKVHIAVFSRSYAESPWCLRELHEMLECRTTHLFLPVFFNVAPSDLRYPSSPQSCYSMAFARLRHQNTPAVIEEWILALLEASMLAGRTFDSYEGSEARLVELIVSDVFQVLNQIRLSIAKQQLVGVDEKLQEALDLMEIQRVQQGLHKLGIYGMGGVGKTTLAKSIYNHIHTKFDGSCYIESVSAKVETSHGLRGVQEQILRALLKSEVTINVSSTSHGKQLMMNRFLDLKILIILDDIDSRAQLEALVSPFEACYLKDGSHLVITSRDKQIVIWAKAQQKLYMQRLNKAHANLLFNCHAFVRPEEPPEELEALAEKVVKACQGLPLALKILGAHLYDKDGALWEATVKVFEDRHRTSAPSLSEVTSFLKISYDGLHTEEKRMFLDIACFMLGESEDRAKRIWCESDAATPCLETLKLKFLVKLDQDGRLTMHDLLRDGAREIVESSHMIVWQRSHIWDETDAQDVLRWRKGASEVRAVRLALGDQGQWNTKSFAGMDSLRFLLLRGEGNIRGDLRLFPKELRWLQWQGCPWKSLPPELDLSKVAVLDLEGSAISSLSDGHMFENLRELTLERCRLLKELPDFRVCCKKLEVLDLYHCIDLERVPESIGCLRSTLTYLDLRGCEKLPALPDAIRRLRCLKSLKLDGCTSLTRLPDTIGQLTALEEIGLASLPSLETLPESLGNLAMLSKLDLLGSCERLQELPSTVGNLRLLSCLFVSGSDIREIPAAVCSLTNLVDLVAINCAAVVRLPEEIGNLCNLKRLDLRGCQRLSHLPSSMGTLGDLVSLVVSGCNIGEGGLPEELWGGLPSLRHLDLSCNPLSRVPEHLHFLAGLQTLDIAGWDDLREIPQLPSSLEVLNTSGCENLREVHTFPPSLIRWDTSYCPRLMRLPSLLCPRDGLAHLEELHASGCVGLRSNVDAIEEFAGLASSSLRRLYLDGTGVSLGPWIEKLVSVEKVILDGESLPECFIRYKQEAHELERKLDGQFEVTMPYTGKDMECKGFVLCAASRGSTSHVQLEIRAPGEEVMHKDLEACTLRYHGLRVEIFRSTRHPFLACLKGGAILSFKFESDPKSLNNKTEAAVRLVQADHEFEEIKAELALAGREGGRGGQCLEKNRGTAYRTRRPVKFVTS